MEQENKKEKKALFGFLGKKEKEEASEVVDENGNPVVEEKKDSKLKKILIFVGTVVFAEFVRELVFGRKKPTEDPITEDISEEPSGQYPWGTGEENEEK